MAQAAGDQAEHGEACAERIDLGDVATYSIDESSSAGDGSVILEFPLAKVPCAEWRDAFEHVKTLQLNYGCGSVELEDQSLRVVTRAEERDSALVALHVHIALTNLRVEQQPLRRAEVDPG